MRDPRAAIALLAAIALGVVSACGSAGEESTNGGDAPEDPAVSQQITVGAIQAWAGFNPYVPDQGVSVGLALANAIYPSAFNVEPGQTASLNEDLLDSADVVSDDPMTVVYQINEDARWSDGTPITADDFIYLWEHLNGSNEELLVTTALGYPQIADIVADGDPKTVKVTFNSPFADWQSLFATLLPAHYMESLGDDTAAWNTGLVTDAAPAGGPYTVAENRDGEFVLLETNPEWYGDEPAISRVTLRLVADDQAAIQGLASGEIDYTLDVKATRASIGQAQALANITTEVTGTSNQQFLNTQLTSPVMSDLALRQAIATAVDPEPLAQAVFGDDVTDLLTTHHIYANTSPHYVDNRPDEFGRGDTEAAAAILEQADYERGDDGMFTKDGEPLVIDYAVRGGDQVSSQAGVIVQDALSQAGIAVEIKTISSADWFGMLGRGDYDLLLGNYPASSFPVSWYGGLYPCGAGYNFAQYCTDEVDALYYQAYGTLDPQVQADLINEVDELLWADVANIPVFSVPQLVSYASNIEGVRASLPKEYQLLDLANWSVG